ncbi:cell surface protein [Chitinispirillum alkaliphilum]|nr:cell surface protein [Chitinispirillum alkaliphilum]
MLWFKKIILLSGMFYLLAFTFCSQDNIVSGGNAVSLAPVITWSSGGEDIFPTGIVQVEAEVAIDNDTTLRATTYFSSRSIEIGPIPSNSLIDITIRGFGAAQDTLFLGRKANVRVGSSDLTVNVQAEEITPIEPSSLSAVITSEGSIRLSWTGGGSNLTGYSLYRKLIGKVPHDSQELQDSYGVLAPMISKDLTSYTDDHNLRSGRVFAYRVHSRNAAGKSFLYAVCTVAIPLQHFTVSFNSNGEEIAPQEVLEGELAEYPNVTERTGYVFTGWYSDTTRWDFESSIVVKNTQLQALWKTESYQIRYNNLHDGTNHPQNPSKYTIETPEIEFLDPSRENMSFKGWYTDSSFSERIFYIEPGSFGNITVYAKWALAKTEASLTLDDLTHVYDNTEKSVTARTDPEGLTVEVTYDDESALPVNAGSYEVTATVRDTAHFGTASGTLIIKKANPIIDAPTASSISFGEALSSSELTGGSASLGANPVEGTFEFTTPTYIPSIGTEYHSVTFTPIDTTNLNSATVSVRVNVGIAEPVITNHPSVSEIVYGQRLKDVILTGGDASVEGTFAFTDPQTKPHAGTGSHSVTFTPHDSVHYATLTFEVSVTVRKAVPGITEVPFSDDIVFGQTLGDATLTGGIASTEGTFAFTTPEIVPVTGVSRYEITFTPNDRDNYEYATAEVSVTVLRATPVINVKPTASPIVFEQTLASSSLTGGSASTDGSFDFDNPGYSPQGAGTTEIDIIFRPDDSENFNEVTFTINITVSKAAITIATLPTARPILFGQTLEKSTLSGGIASVEGKFVFTSPETKPSIGTRDHSVIFTPNDTSNYNATTLLVEVEVSPTPPLTIDGVTYTTVVIGNQLWTVENLRATVYHDGTEISHIAGSDNWWNAGNDSIPAFCFYDNTTDESEMAKFGALYNWWVVADTTKTFASGGWRVPNNDDWDILFNTVGGQSNAGRILKASGSVDWDSDPQHVGTNEYGWTGLPGGNRTRLGAFSEKGKAGFWISASGPEYAKNMWSRTSAVTNVVTQRGIPPYGFSIRLVKDLD